MNVETVKTPKTAKRTRQAEIVREYGPFPGIASVHGVTHDGEHVWFATDAKLAALDPETGAVVRALDVPADAGTAFDGTHLYQLAEDKILKIERATGKVVGSLPAPGKGMDSGLAWADGTLWVGQYKDRCLHQIDAQDGRILRTLRSDRFVTGITWTDGELWHGTWEGEDGDLRRVDPESGEVLEAIELPGGVSGLEAKGDVFFCGGGKTGKVRVVRR